MINENDLAIKIAKREGKKLAVSIGQIKEVQKILLSMLARFKGSEVLALVEKHR